MYAEKFELNRKPDTLNDRSTCIRFFCEIKNKSSKKKMKVRKISNPKNCPCLLKEQLQ